jgi:hypothetical protein
MGMPIEQLHEVRLCGVGQTHYRNKCETESDPFHKTESPSLGIHVVDRPNLFCVGFRMFEGGLNFHGEGSTTASDARRVVEKTDHPRKFGRRKRFQNDVS